MNPFSPLIIGNPEIQHTQKSGLALSGGRQLSDQPRFSSWLSLPFPPCPFVMLPGFALPNKVIASKTSALGSFSFQNEA